MLSYRHAYHAGNFADVLKHLVVTALIQALRRKDKPFFYLDTHSGIGRYDLQNEIAAKTAEWHEGIGRLWHSNSPPELVAEYLRLVREQNPNETLRYYPGSPCLVRSLLRENDRMWLCELHPRDIEQLREIFSRDRQVKVAFEDGFQTIKAVLPAKEKRGLVLIDPSYEIKTDYQRVVTAMQQGYRRFATGIYAIWYPVVHRPWVDQLLNGVRNSGVSSALVVEHNIQADNTGGMTGSGMIVINPPWQFADTMLETLPWLNKALGVEDSATFQVEWLVVKE